MNKILTIFPSKNTIPQATTKITTDLIAVAKLEFTFSTPILAKIVVNASTVLFERSPKEVVEKR